VLNFFATVIEVLQCHNGKSVEVEEDITAGDYSHGFSKGTEQALSANNRQTAVISLQQFNVFSLSMLIALHECAVGFYANSAPMESKFARRFIFRRKFSGEAFFKHFWKKKDRFLLLLP
jgi:hypothetical protein